MTTVDFDESPPLSDTEGFVRFLTGSGCSVPVGADSAALYIGMPPGASVTVTPSASAATVYFGVDAFDPGATAAGGTPEQSSAVLCGLAPGEYDLDFTGTTGNCGFAEGWSSSGHDVRARVEKGAMTIINWICL